MKMNLKHRGDLREVLEIFGDLPPRWLLHGARKYLAINIANMKKGLVPVEYKKWNQQLKDLNDLENRYKEKDTWFVNYKGRGNNGRKKRTSIPTKNRSRL